MSLAGRDEKGIHELDRCMTDKCMRRLREAELERDEFKAHCEELSKEHEILIENHNSILDRINEMTRLYDAEDFYRAAASVDTNHFVSCFAGQSPKQSLAEIQAKAIKEFIQDIRKLGVPYNPIDNPPQDVVGYNEGLHEVISRGEMYANQLRAKAKEGVK